MGIPLFFRKIVSQNQGLIIEKAPKCQRLFLDFNGIIHGAAARVLQESTPNVSKEQHEERIIKETIAYMDTIVAYVMPHELLFLGIDGVAPLAKIQQQRSRRHMSHFLKTLETYVPPNFEWDTNAISPGTEFMCKCATALRAHFETKRHPFKCVVSDSFEVGEGEHKIFNYIESFPSNEGNDVVYGLDADLMMLGLISKQTHIYLLREPVHFRHDERSKPFLYFDVNTFRSALRSRYNNAIDLRSYVFLCFMIGNDFLPPLGFLHIRNNDIDRLVHVYLRLIDDCSALERPSIIYHDGAKYRLDSELFEGVLRALSDKEPELYKKAHLAYFNQSTNHLKTKEQRFENYGIYKKNRALQGIFDGNWIQSYYVELFDMSVTPDSLIHDACSYYLKGLIWTSEYYFNKTNAFRWFYPYAYSPTIIDLYNLVQTSYEQISLICDKLPSIHIEPELQLLMILPIQSKSLLPKHLQKFVERDSPLGYMFPRSFELQTYMKIKLHECIPVLPKLQVNHFIKIYEQPN